MAESSTEDVVDRPTIPAQSSSEHTTPVSIAAPSGVRVVAQLGAVISKSEGSSQIGAAQTGNWLPSVPHGRGCAIVRSSLDPHSNSSEASLRTREDCQKELLRLHTPLSTRTRLREIGVRENTEAASDEEERAVLSGARYNLDALDAILVRQLEQVDRALQRMAEGVYDRCARCSRKISLERHSVRPEATRCVGCQRELAL